MNIIKPSYKIIFGIILAVFACNQPKRSLNSEPLVEGLELLSSEKTGIDFNNRIIESKSENFLHNSQIYNGAGVAIGDINNDGLPDIFFCGNQVHDRLYLNKGGFQFEDITKISNVANNSGWSWGVTMADINNDGHLDIYVSRNGASMNPKDRKNQLYINNKDATFTESAKAFGLADLGFSSQAVFFDMDNDGDLDMYQVNQLPDPRIYKRHGIKNEDVKYYTDKFYKFDNGFFFDVSDDVVTERPLTHGLNVNATDFNNDGWIDLYVTNDYDEPDFMYYNNGDGTFKNVIKDKLKHISRFSMGSDTGDINNDGSIDFMTLDMASEDHYRSKTNMGSMSTSYFDNMVNTGKHHQYMFNTLQINSGNGHFSDVANLAGVAQTDWSWSSLIVDVNNDGWKDILVSNGIKKDMRNNDYVTLLNEKINTGAIDFYTISKNAPSVPLPNYIYKNKGSLEFEKVSKNWGFNTLSFSSGMAYGDLDNDGDLDIVTNNMDAPAFVYDNKATGNFLKIKFEGPENNRFGYGAKAIIHHNNNKQISVNFVSRGYLSSVEPNLFFGLGLDMEVEKLEIIWPDGKTNTLNNITANQILTIKHSKADGSLKEKKASKTIFDKRKPPYLGLNFRHQENNFDEFKTEVLLPHNISENGPFMATADVNGDGLEDMFVGGASGQSGVLYLQNEDENFNKSPYQPWEKDLISEDLQALFLDIDGDHDQDLYVTSGGSEFKRGNPLLKDRIYINNGPGKFIKNNRALPNIYESTQCVKASDVDNDGDLDLFVGTRVIAGKYGFPASSYLLINTNGMYQKAPKEKAPGLYNIGMVTDAVFSDIDTDGDDDLILVGEWMQISVLLNNNGIYENHTDNFGLNDTRGLWWSITASDLDGDGDDDYIVGNLGKNNKFKTSKERPFKLYANDFDNNGTNDIILAKFYKADYVPVRGRECTSQQMPYISEKFKDYHSFASSKVLEILPKAKLKDAVVYEISNFESIILINENGKLIRRPLPNEAQLSPLKSCLVNDFNKDGFMDVLTVGNHYGVEVETKRYDAGLGTLLLGDGENNFRFVPPNHSGFYVPSDSRHITHINQKNDNLIIVTNNNDSISVFQHNKK